MKTRKNILIVLGLVLLLGGSYAFYTYQKYSGMQNLLNGEIYLNYLEDNEVHISGIFPETKEEALKRDDNTISFKVLSKNTSDKDIYYGITLNYGEEISNKIRIDAKYIMIYLECDGKVLIDGIRYSDFNNRRIYVDKIDAKTYTETTKNYNLRFWVDEETMISDTDNNASYKATEWANSYLNFKVNVDAGLETMNMPLSMETSDTFVENNKAYFIAKISNFINIEDLGKDSNDTMNLKVTGTNSDIKFSYKDSEGNTVEEKSEILDLTYLFTKNKTVEIQVFVHPNNDANGKTNVLLEIYKNKELMQSFIKRVEVKGNNYCLNNGFNKLVDCMLVSDSLSESVDVAKTNIPRIRFVTSHPWDFTDEMLDVIAKYDNIMPYIHLPIQSGSDRILKLMGRKYTKEEYITLFNKIKEKIPNVAISTDIIVGFPGETEEDFNETLDVVNKLKYDLEYVKIESFKVDVKLFFLSIYEVITEIFGYFKKSK